MLDFTPIDAANYTNASKNVTINVSAQPVLPVANFNANVTDGDVPLSVQFNDSSTNATSWNWDFGDGNNSTEQNPVHTLLCSRKLHGKPDSKQCKRDEFNYRYNNCFCNTWLKYY